MERTRTLGSCGRSVGAEASLARTLCCRGHLVRADAHLELTLSPRGHFVGADAWLAWTFRWRGCSVGADAQFVQKLRSRGRSVRADALFVRTLLVRARSVRADAVTFLKTCQAGLYRLLYGTGPLEFKSISVALCQLRRVCWQNVAPRGQLYRTFIFISWRLSLRPRQALFTLQARGVLGMTTADDKVRFV